MADVDYNYKAMDYDYMVSHGQFSSGLCPEDCIQYEPQTQTRRVAGVRCTHRRVSLPNSRRIPISRIDAKIVGKASSPSPTIESKRTIRRPSRASTTTVPTACCDRPTAVSLTARPRKQPRTLAIYSKQRSAHTKLPIASRLVPDDLESGMALEPPVHDFESLGPLPTEFDPLSENYVAPRYDADFWPLYEEDEPSPSATLPYGTSPASRLLLGECVYEHSSTSPSPHECEAEQQQQQQQQPTFLTNESGSSFCESPFASFAGADAPAIPCESAMLDVVASTSCSPDSRSSVSLQPDLVELDTTDFAESFIDLAELDQYLNAPEESASSTAVQPESMFDTIIRTDQYENSVAVQLDHTYGTPPSALTPVDSMDLDPSILNEFFSPVPSTSPMGPCSGSVDTSTSYLEKFTNLDPYIEKQEEPLSPQHDCHELPSCSSVASHAPSTTPDSVATALSRFVDTPSDYRVRRDRNNLASQKSRRKRQMKFQALKGEEVELKKRNTELLATVSDLERQVNNLKDIMMKAVSG